MAMGDYMWTRAETKYNINVNMRPEYEPITIRGRQIKAQIQGIKEVTYGGKTTITRYLDVEQNQLGFLGFGNHKNSYRNFGDFQRQGELIWLHTVLVEYEQVVEIHWTLPS